MLTEELRFFSLQKFRPRVIQKIGPFRVDRDSALRPQMLNEGVAVEEEVGGKVPKAATVFEKDDSEDAAVISKLF